MPACSSPPPRVTAGPTPARSRTRARGSRPSPQARTTATATARSRSATARPTTARPSRHRSVRLPFIDSTAAGLPARMPTSAGALLHGGRQRRCRRPRPGEGRRQDRPLRPRRQRSRQQEPRGAGGRRRRHGSRQHQRQLAQRRLPLRPDRAPVTTRDRPAVKAYAATAGATATINAVDDHLRDPGAVHRGVLVARPADAPAVATC